MASERVYELDIERLMSDLTDVLSGHGYEVIEQTPAGVWWFKTADDREDAYRQIATVMAKLLANGLREISQ